MSRDQDGQQRLWLSLGYGGKTAVVNTWRYWPAAGKKSTWVISAPNNLDEFEQRGRVVFYLGEKILEGATQWRATWAALGALLLGDSSNAASATARSLALKSHGVRGSRPER